MLVSDADWFTRLMQFLTLMSTTWIAFLTIRMQHQAKINARRARRARRQNKEEMLASIESAGLMRKDEIIAGVDALSKQIAETSDAILKTATAVMPHHEPRGIVVLFVDDTASNRMIMNLRLTQAGYIVLEAHNGDEALNMLYQNHVDAVISDLVMAPMNGLRLCETMRGIPRFKHLPFILFTMNWDQLGGPEAARLAGVDAFVVKPANIEALLHALEEKLHIPAEDLPI